MVLFVVSFGLFMEEFLYGMIAPLTPASPAQIKDEHMISTLYGAYAIGLIISTPVLGIITDRLGRRQPMLVGVVLLLISTVLFCIGANREMHFVGRVLQGAGAACTWTAGLALVAECFVKNRVRAMAFATLGATTGSIVGPYVGSELCERGGYALPFYIMIGCLLIDAVLRFYFIAPSKVLANQGPWSRTMRELGGIVMDRSVLSAAFAVALAAASWALMEPLFPMHVIRIANATPTTIGALFTASNLLYAVVPPFVGYVSDRLGVRQTVALGLILTAIVMPLLALSPNLFLATTVLCLITVSYALTINPTSAELGDAVDRRGSTSYAVAYAVYNLAYSFGMLGVDTFIEFATDAAHKLELLQILLIMSGLFALCVPLFLFKPKGLPESVSQEAESQPSP